MRHSGGRSDGCRRSHAFPLALLFHVVILSTPSHAQSSMSVPCMTTAEVESIALVRDVGVMRELPGSAQRIFAVDVTVAATGLYGLEVRLPVDAPDGYAVRVAGGPWLALNAGDWRELLAGEPGVRVVRLEFTFTKTGGQPDPGIPRPAPALEYRAVVR